MAAAHEYVPSSHLHTRQQKFLNSSQEGCQEALKPHRKVWKTLLCRQKEVSQSITSQSKVLPHHALSCILQEARERIGEPARPKSLTHHKAETWHQLCFQQKATTEQKMDYKQVARAPSTVPTGTLQTHKFLKHETHSAAVSSTISQRGGSRVIWSKPQGKKKTAK